MKQFIIEKRHNIVGGRSWFYGPFPIEDKDRILRACREYAESHYFCFHFFAWSLRDAESEMLSTFGAAGQDKDWVHEKRR